MKTQFLRLSFRLFLVGSAVNLFALVAQADAPDFEKAVAPLLAQHCVRCHSGASPKGGLDLSTRAGLLKGGENGPAVTPREVDSSLLLDYLTGDPPLMPKSGPRLSKVQVEQIRNWIAAGAAWPDRLVLKEDRGEWWSWRPLQRPAIPGISEANADSRHPIDAFLLAKLQEQGLTFSPEADRKTLVRRLTFDLTGLPPTPEEIAVFVADASPNAYEKLVNRLLDSPRYGERWARHWLDVVHYGDTHGYDKDKRRPNAWPYRDYVIRAFNSDKPYSRFIQEQLAGDVLFPNSSDGVAATGFIAAGPWDFVGQVELREGTTDKLITRNLDRDDMVTNAMSTFVSLTVHCARCHDHKFDPIPQRDYYALQAVFAGVDRADRPFDADPAVTARRAELNREKATLEAKSTLVEWQVEALTSPEVIALNQKIIESSSQNLGPERAEFGYHSQIAAKPDVEKWVQIDLGKSTEIAQLIYVGCHDTFNNIGAGFGFPVRYRIDVSNDPEMKQEVRTVLDKSKTNVANPGIVPQSVSLEGVTARYVRFTATKLALRQNDYIFALAELAVLTGEGTNAAIGAKVSSLDSIEAGPRWGVKNLVDGFSYRSVSVENLAVTAQLVTKRDALLATLLTPELKEQRSAIQAAIQRANSELAQLPPRQNVYAASSSFSPVGGFTATNGRPRTVHLLHRGDVKSPREEVNPGSLTSINELPGTFRLTDAMNEGERRVALAEWIIDRRNPLTWRSIVNRVWHYHFGRGIVESPNDFGRMGQLPTHPELLDWLAVEFRDNGQSLKSLHRLIVTSAAYRQGSGFRIQRSGIGQSPAVATAGMLSGEKIDSGNRLLWRMNRRRLDAEEIRDAVLFVSGQMDLTMGGPGFDLFGFQDDHSPHYKYEEYNPDDPRTHRRSIYRFIVRSVPDPLMETFDCADPSLITPVRQTTMTPQQALALLNNKLMVRQAERFAERVKSLSKDGLTPVDAINAAIQLALGREATADERTLLDEYAVKHGLPATCRLILNMNEFVFVD